MPDAAEEEEEEDCLNNELVCIRSPAPRCVFCARLMDVGLFEREAICDSEKRVFRPSAWCQ
jgi:hypothetical protein